MSSVPYGSRGVERSDGLESRRAAAHRYSRHRWCTQRAITGREGLRLGMGVNRAGPPQGVVEVADDVVQSDHSIETGLGEYEQRLGVDA